MDKKLLDALNNLASALDYLSESMKDAKGNKDKSSTSTALISGKLDKKIDAIDKGVKQIQSDNKKILKNQEQLIKLAKEKQGGGAVGDASDPKQKSRIKDGLGTIMMIAVGVLAIGMAFKLIGSINFVSVLALAMALPLIAIAFEKISKMKNLKGGQMMNILKVVLVMSTAIALSSFILNMVQPVGIFKLITAVFIGGTFAALAYGMPKLLKGFEKANVAGVGKMILFGPAVLLALSTAIALSSHVLGFIKPVGIFKLITAVFIAGAFAALGYGLGKIIDAFSKMKINPTEAAAAAVLMPIVFVAMSWAIAGASLAFQYIKPVGLFKLITAALIGVVFIPLSFALPYIAKAMKTVDIKNAALIPGIMVLLATAIWLTSLIFAQTTIIDPGNMLKILLQGAVLAAISYAMAPAIKALGKLSPKELIKGGIAVLGIAAVIMGASHILSFGNYTNVISLEWVGTTALAMGLFGTAVFALGVIASSGIGAVALLAGGVAVLGLAAVIVGSSHILAQGNYGAKINLDWVGSTALAMGLFGAAVIALGTIAVTGIGAVSLLAGGVAVLGVAETILRVSKILEKGNYKSPNIMEWAQATSLLYWTFTPLMMMLAPLSLAFSFDPEKGYIPKMMIGIAKTIVKVSEVFKGTTWENGPTKAWAEGVGLAIGAFSPVYKMISDTGLLALLGAGPTPEKFKEAILTITDGIIYSAGLFDGFSGAFKDGPKKEWVEGVGLAIGAFAPVYDMLAKSKDGWLKKGGPTPEEFKQAIMVTSQGILDAANFFGKNISSFDLKNVPKKEWGESVGAALQAFMPALEFISKNAGWLSGADPTIISKAINSTAMGIVSSSIILSGGLYKSTVPSEWSKSVGEAIRSYVGLAADYLYPKREWIHDALNNFEWVTYSMLNTSKRFKEIGSNISGVDESWMKNVSSNVRSYVELAKWLTENKVNTGVVNSSVNGMKNLSKGYSNLANAVSKLNAELEELDVEKLNALKNLNASVVLMSLMDSDQFSSMMDELESKGGVLLGAIKDLDEKGAEATKKGAPSPTIKSGTGGPTQPQRSMDDLFSVMQSVDAKLGSIASSSDKLSKYVDEIRADDPLIKKNR